MPEVPSEGGKIRHIPETGPRQNRKLCHSCVAVLMQLSCMCSYHRKNNPHGSQNALRHLPWVSAAPMLLYADFSNQYPTSLGRKQEESGGGREGVGGNRHVLHREEYIHTHSRH